MGIHAVRLQRRRRRGTIPHRGRLPRLVHLAGPRMLRVPGLAGRRPRRVQLEGGPVARVRVGAHGHEVGRVHGPRAGVVRHAHGRAPHRAGEPSPGEPPRRGPGGNIIWRLRQRILRWIERKYAFFGFRSNRVSYNDSSSNFEWPSNADACADFSGTYRGVDADGWFWEHSLANPIHWRATSKSPIHDLVSNDPLDEQRSFTSSVFSCEAPRLFIRQGSSRRIFISCGSFASWSKLAGCYPQ